MLLSPHCADHTEGWLNDAMGFFIENFHRFAKGEPCKMSSIRKRGTEGDDRRYSQSARQESSRSSIARPS